MGIRSRGEEAGEQLLGASHLYSSPNKSFQVKGGVITRRVSTRGEYGAMRAKFLSINRKASNSLKI